MKKMNQETEEQVTKISNWANGFHILSLIGRILLYFATILLFGLLIFTPKITNNIKIENNKITLFNEVIEYKIHDADILTLKHEKDEKTINFKKIANPVIKALENINNGKLKNLMFTSIIIAIITIVISIIILKKLDELLIRIKEENKVFVSDGNKKIVTITWLLLASLIVKTLGGFIIAMMVGTNSIRINIDFEVIIYLLFVYFISLIYKYGETLEKE